MTSSGVIHLRQELEVWGTVLFIDVASPDVDEVDLHKAINHVRDFSFQVDELFSTYKAD